MSWTKLTVAPEGTHHLLAQEPAYETRFDEVLPFHAPGLAPTLTAGVAWHINEHGLPAYERRFRRVFGFYEGLAAVVDVDGWHPVDPNARDISTARFAWVGNFQGHRVAVRNFDQRYYHLNREGEPAYARRWRYAGDFREGSAVVQADDGYSTHIDRDGAFVHEHWFIDLDVFHKGFARARDADGWVHIDRLGKPIYGDRFAAIEPFYNGQARVERMDGSLAIIAPSGQVLVDLRPPRRSELAR